MHETALFERKLSAVFLLAALAFAGYCWGSFFASPTITEASIPLKRLGPLNRFQGTLKDASKTSSRTYNKRVSVDEAVAWKTDALMIVGVAEDRVRSRPTIRVEFWRADPETPGLFEAARVRIKTPWDTTWYVPREASFRGRTIHVTAALDPKDLFLKLGLSTSLLIAAACYFTAQWLARSRN